MYRVFTDPRVAERLCQGSEISHLKQLMKTVPKLTRDEEPFHHFGLLDVAKLFQLVNPESLATFIRVNSTTR